MAKIKKSDKTLNPFVDENGEYKKQRIDWWRIAKIITILVVVLGTIYLIWAFAFGGQKFLRMKNEASLMYETVFHDNDIDKYEEETKAEWTSEAWSELESINDELISKDFSYGKPYVVEISLENSKSDCWIAITDKTRTITDDPDDVKPMKSLFVHEVIEEGDLTITEIKDPYDKTE